MATAITDSAPRPRRPTRPVPIAPLETVAVPHDDQGIPTVESPSDEAPASTSEPSTDLTPIRAHYLKKALIQLQFNDELDAITSAPPSNISTFSYLGPPFSPPPTNGPSLDLPFLRYIFRQFVLTFPFMAAAPKDFYSDKLQPFMASVLSRNLSPTSPFDANSDSAEKATRIKLLGKMERNLSMFVGAATKLQEQEQVVRLTQHDLDRLEALARKRQKRNLKQRDIFEVNVVSVRTITDKGRMRNRVHDEFIIRTRRSDLPDQFVSRRYGDFKTLATELHKMHPEEDIRSPPVKDRSTVTMTPASPTSGSYVYDDDYGPASPLPTHPSRLSREKNRLTLRAYLHSLLSSSTIASSPVLRSFLLSSPITLNSEELEDARRREDADHVREEGRKRFAKEIAERIDGLRDAVRSVKGDVMGKDGLTHLFGVIKVTPNICDLPPSYQAVFEWARISVASAVFHQFVAKDDSSQNFATVKRLHGLMPYFMLKTALKISNPIAMIRNILDLFLAQPFGGKSLLQRMFSGSLQEEVRVLEEEIVAVKEKVEDPVMCEKVKRFVYGAKEIQDLYKSDALAEKLPLLTVVLRSGDEPALTRQQLQRVARAHRAHAAYTKHKETLYDSDDDDGPQDEDAWLYEDLKHLAHLYTRLRDREQLIDLIFEGFTADLLKDIITIFYTPLATVYRAASIADSLGDLQAFINDLLKTVESVEELSQEDPHRTVQAFIDLVQRHEQSFYNFVYKVHSKGESLFDSLMRWIELFITVLRDGIGGELSLEFLLPHLPEERRKILEEVDKVATYHYKLKIAHEDKVRRRFGRASGKADSEEQEVEKMVENIVGELNFGDLVSGDVAELAAADSGSDETGSSDEEDEDEDEDDETDSSDEGSTQSGETTSSYETTSSEGQSRQPLRKPPLQPSRTMSFSSPPPQPHVRTMSLSAQSRPQQLPSSPSSTPTLRKTPSSIFQDMKQAIARKKEDVPPVPPMPGLARASTITAAVNKPLPMNPGFPRPSIDSTRSLPLANSPSVKSAPPTKQTFDLGRPTASRSSTITPSRSNTIIPSRQDNSSAAPKQAPRKARRKKEGEKIEAPDLEYIPTLLPIFKELIRPALRIRQRS
ncbi:hypothetical protein CYLTODRAFT_435231 [Cylindrobasidium torrendii FP15055 ss-10]|uniref:PX domain-containing protein n=1 Tax=Cylindrobasidium torrendii FP15055 ss-10 TaxID=1314674 RepID=A0A0D7BLV9_9AGAR|nr:hypothetical protein CYLTODRAFT_435231 [Cylindrobasidium torrendii FP15055 ss-10]